MKGHFCNFLDELILSGTFLKNGLYPQPNKKFKDGIKYQQLPHRQTADNVSSIIEKLLQNHLPYMSKACCHNITKSNIVDPLLRTRYGNKLLCSKKLSQNTLISRSRNHNYYWKAQPSKLESSAFFSCSYGKSFSPLNFQRGMAPRWTVRVYWNHQDCFSDKISKKNRLENLAK